MKFNRQIGDYAGEFYSIEGNPLNEGEFQAHTTQVLPGLDAGAPGVHPGEGRAGTDRGSASENLELS